MAINLTLCRFNQSEIILQICRDIAQGLRFLHTSRPPILHGDLKGRNILIDSRFRAKLCDFGLSTKKSLKITGTPFWLAPEYLRGQSGYTVQCDMYSFAIVLNEIYSRKTPYQGEDFRSTLRQVCDRRINKRPDIPPTCPPKMVELMRRCWHPDAMSRPQAKDLDIYLLDMNVKEAEPLTAEQQALSKKRTGDMIYELFPKHIADALKCMSRYVRTRLASFVFINFICVPTLTQCYFDKISRTKSGTRATRKGHCHLFRHRAFYGYFQEYYSIENFEYAGSPLQCL